MAGMRNYGTGLYKEFETLNKKLDKANSTIFNMSLTINELNLTIREMQKQHEEDQKLIEKLVEENEKLKNQNNKNSSNSSKPSSTDISKPKKKTGANIYNYRVKSDKKQGGQKGHVGHNLSKKEIEDLIKEKKLEVKEIEHIINGSSTKEPIIKYVLGLEIKPYVEKHIFKFSKTSKEKLPKIFYTDVTYGTSIKTLAIDLGVYNVISYDRISEFFEVITKGILRITKGTLINFLYEFSDKSKSTIKILEEQFLNSNIGYTDETTTKLNGKNMYVRNYSVEDSVIYKAHKNKGDKPIEEDNILTRFLGGIMADHDTGIYKYGTKNYECNIHVGRYLEELIQNVPDLLWPIKMKELLFRIERTRKIAKEYNETEFSKEKIEEYNKEYDEIIELAIKENEKRYSTYWKEKSKKLYNRLKKYKKNHLYFIENFDIPFDNNKSEQDLRIFKNKTKISGCFRNIEAASKYVDALTIIKTAIKREINPYEAISDIFDNKVLFAK